MGKLCSPNIAAQIDLFLGVLPAFLGVLLIFPHTQTLMSSILNSFSFTTSIECQEKLMKQGSVCTNATEHATSAQGRVMLFHFFVFTVLENCVEHDGSCAAHCYRGSVYQGSSSCNINR